jgi:hypothetical protein
MSSYDLKVAGMLKEGVDPAQAEKAAAAFHDIFFPASPSGSWVEEFVLSPDTILKQDATVEDEAWVLLIGSSLEANTVVKTDSVLNGKPVGADMPLKAKTPVTSHTALVAGSLLAKGSLLKNEPYTKAFWRAEMEDTLEWGDGTSGPQKVGTYGVLTFQGMVATIRRASLGQQWARQTALDDLEWFYKYRKTPWFLGLLKELIAFNKQWEPILEEEARIRDLKWYCGDGSGP